MRISSLQLKNSYWTQLNKSYDNQARIMRDGNGSTLHVPSDNSVDYSKYLRYQNSSAENDQYTNNVKNAISWMKSADAALISITDIESNIVEKSHQAASDTNQEVNLMEIAKEVMGNVREIVAKANTQQGDNYAFAGQKVTVEPFVLSEERVERGLIKTLSDNQIKYFYDTDNTGYRNQMLVLEGSDKNTYYLNTLTGYIYPKEFVEEGYKYLDVEEKAPWTGSVGQIPIYDTDQGRKGFQVSDYFNSYGIIKTKEVTDAEGNVTKVRLDDLPIDPTNPSMIGQLPAKQWTHAQLTTYGPEGISQANVNYPDSDNMANIIFPELAGHFKGTAGTDGKSGSVDLYTTPIQPLSGSAGFYSAGPTTIGTSSIVQESTTANADGFYPQELIADRKIIRYQNESSGQYFYTYEDDQTTFYTSYSTSTTYATEQYYERDDDGNLVPNDTNPNVLTRTVATGNVYELGGDTYTKDGDATTGSYYVMRNAQDSDAWDLISVNQNGDTPAVSLAVYDGKNNPKTIEYTYNDLYNGKATLSDASLWINNKEPYEGTGDLNITANYFPEPDTFLLHNEEKGSSNIIELTAGNDNTSVLLDNLNLHAMSSDGSVGSESTYAKGYDSEEITYRFVTIEQPLVTYHGDLNYISMVKRNGAIQPAEDTVNANGRDIFGTNIFDDDNSGNDPSGAAGLNDLLMVYQKMRSNDTHWMMSDAVTVTDEIHRITVDAQTVVGARQQVYEEAEQVLANQNDVILEDINTVSGTDLAKYAVDLLAAQTLYQLSLSIGNRIVPPSLMDYL